jgi:V/A-type H+-transporting ATPase subunit I
MLSTPQPMVRMKLKLIAEDAQLAASVLANLELVHLESIREGEELLKEFPAQVFHDHYHNLKARYKKVMVYATDDVRVDTACPLDQVVEKDLEQAAEVIKDIWLEVSAIEERLRQLQEETSANNQLLANLQRFLSLDINLNRLGKNSRFLNVQVGSVPSANFNRLQRALSMTGHMIDSFHKGEGSDYVVIVGPAEHREESREVQRSADFRELEIPEEFSDRPSTVRQRLLDKRKAIDAVVSEQQRQLTEVIQANADTLRHIGTLLYCAMPYAGIAAHLRGKGSLATLEGWLPESRRAELRQALDDSIANAYLLEFQTPASAELEQVPTKLKTNWLLEPFDKLVGQFGMPLYGEFNPALLFALSYILMFGMMFGDIGHGAIIFVGGLFFWRKYPSVGVVATLAGMSSAFFGYVYGSLFGYEHVIHPLWMSPMEDPQHVLMLALVWGIGFLIIANLLSIRNAFAFGRREQALYSPQGIAGLVFYLAAIVYMLDAFDAIIAPSGLAALVVVASMVVMLVHQWRETEGKLFERILMIAIEGLEIVINNVSATLSFLRVAAFTLNHIALAAAVFAIAGMLDTFGHWVTVVLGNVFIIVLEGAIVAIQCLRLEYYEGFSRFFSGKGRPFQPLKIESL